MIRPYCGECGQEMTTCECPEDERFPMLNMTQEDFDAALAEAYQRGQEDMRKRAHDQEMLRKRRSVCQCGYGKKGNPCKMSCPGSEVEP